MKTYLHRSDERGIAEHGWLHSRFSFSFAEYHNRERMGFGALRVINDDIVEPGGGFGMHPHRDMEIVTLVIKGTLEHKDSDGNHGLIHAGEVQYMSAGSGIEHSEFNPSPDERVELFQIWIHPHTRGLLPRYEQRDFHHQGSRNRWMLIISSDGREDSIAIRQNAFIRTARLQEAHSLISEPLVEGHGRLLMVIEGEVSSCGYTLGRRDELQVISKRPFEITANEDSLLVIFDVPMG